MPEQTLETAMARLEQIVRELESGDKALADGLELFREGIELARLCQQRLDEAEAKIEQLLDTSAKEPTTIPLNPGDA